MDVDSVTSSSEYHSEASKSRSSLEVSLSPKSVTALPGLTSIRPPPTLLLVSLHTRSELDIDSRWRGKPETFGYFDQIELVDVKDRPEAVTGVCLQIGSIAVFGGLEVEESMVSTIRVATCM